MAFVNYNNKEITVKIVYYGPALSGKTTCLRYIYSSREYSNKGKLITLDTDGDRTLFFDFLPIQIGKLGDYSIKIQLYTVPGQVAYDTTRKLVLQGADGVVFVADSQVAMRKQNIESFKNMRRNLMLNNISYADVPIILQYNKRDLQEILPVADLDRDLNTENHPSFATVATTGEEIISGLSEIMKMVVVSLKNKLSIFQRDKTVMFSRDDITASSPGTKKRAASGFELSEKKPYEDTEDEDIFELDAPLEIEPTSPKKISPGEISAAPIPGEEEEIFDLSDEQALPDLNPLDIEIPEADMEESAVISREEAGKNKKPAGSGKSRTDSWQSEPVFEKSSTPAAKKTGIEIDIDQETAVIPLEITVPEKTGEIHLKIKLDITIKKKK